MLVVDAFTDRPLVGNPAGVCLLDRPVDADWMQQVAAEMKHSETAFIRPVEAPEADFELRWFTPVAEVALCGHATLAGAHALYETGMARSGRPIRFQTLRSGRLTVTRASDGGLLMDFPACPATEAAPPDDLSEALGATALWVGRNSQNDLLMRLADEVAARGLSPGVDALARMDVHGVIATAVADPRPGVRVRLPLLRRRQAARRTRGPGDRLRPLLRAGPLLGRTARPHRAARIPGVDARLPRPAAGPSVPRSGTDPESSTAPCPADAGPGARSPHEPKRTGAAHALT